MNSTTITKIYCRQVLSDRGHPAIEVKVITESGAIGVAMCTAGISVGSHEVPYLYDGGPLWGGKGVSKAVNNIREHIAPSLIGIDSSNQAKADALILKTVAEKRNYPIGGNGIAALSAAILKAGAAALEIPLYRHIGGINAVTLPLASYGCYFGSTRYGARGKAGVKPTCSFIAYDFNSYVEASEALHHLTKEWEQKVFEKMGIMITPINFSILASGFAMIPPGLVNSDEYLWDLASETIINCGYEGRIGLQMDIAADSFYDPKTKLYNGIFSKEPKTRDAMIDMAIKMSKEYPFVIIEDPLHEDDFEGFKIITKETGIQIVGDDLFATNSKRVCQGAKLGAGNAVLMKVNQIGTITEALEMVHTAYSLGYGVMPCNSRGEGIDIVDYSVGINAGTIREAALGFTGNRFIKIEEDLGARSKYLGKMALKGWRFSK